MILPTGLLSITVGANTDRPDAPHSGRLLAGAMEKVGLQTGLLSLTIRAYLPARCKR